MYSKVMCWVALDRAVALAGYLTLVLLIGSVALPWVLWPRPAASLWLTT